MDMIDNTIQIAMNIITWAGAAKSDYLQALAHAKKNQFVESRKMIENADAYFIKAHKYHYDMIAAEANESKINITLLLIHAEDQLMNADSVKILVKELVEIYERGVVNE